METFDSLRKDARALEQSLEHRLQAFSRLGDASAIVATDKKDEESGLGGDSETVLVREIEEDLRKLGVLIEKLSSNLTDNPSRINAAVVQRFRELSGEFRRHFRMHQTTLRASRDKAALFRQVRHQSAAAASGSTNATDTLLRERSSLLNASRSLDGALAEAGETRESLARQRAGLASTTGNLSSMILKIPGVGILMDSIESRRLRNDRIVAVVIALVLVFFIWWYFGGALSYLLSGSGATISMKEDSNPAASTETKPIDDAAGVHR